MPSFFFSAAVESYLSANVISASISALCIICERRAQLALRRDGERDGCLVYANGAWEAEKTAEALAALRPAHEPPQEVQDFITYIKENIHAEYALLKTLKAGVAFHHGEMPAGVRAG